MATTPTSAQTAEMPQNRPADKAEKSPVISWKRTARNMVLVFAAGISIGALAAVMRSKPPQ